jgi:ABC-type branched-subunit amino acid transport system substrate-binding protein
MQAPVGDPVAAVSPEAPADGAAVPEGAAAGGSPVAGSAAPRGGGAAATSATAAGRGTAAGPAATPGQNSAKPGAGPAATGGGSAPSGNPGAAAGGTSGGGAKVTAAGPDSQGITADRIKLGVLAPISGAAGFLGEVEVASIRAYLETVNASGGVGGRRYQLVVLDTQLEPSIEAVATKRLVDQDKVFALFSLVGDSSAPYVTSKGIPVVVLGMTNPAFSSRYPTIYPLHSTVDAVAKMAYQLTQVLKVPIKSTAVLYDTQNVPIEPWAKYMAKAFEIWGVQVKSVDRFNLSDGDCTQIVVKLQRLAIDYWQIAQTLGWPLCEQAMHRQNWIPPHGRGGPDTADAYFIAQVGPKGDGVIANGLGGVQIARNYGQPWPYNKEGKAPAVDAYVESMKKYSPRNADMRSLESIWAQFYWSAAKLIDEAIKAQSGSITWKGVNQWIQGQTAWTSGVLAPINFSPRCKTGTGVWLFQWKYDGQQFVQGDWQPYGGPIELPTEAKNKIVPGAGDCYITAMSDAEL